MELAHQILEGMGIVAVLMLIIQAGGGIKNWLAARKENLDLAARMREHEIETALNALHAAVDRLSPPVELELVEPNEGHVEGHTEPPAEQHVGG
jgi:hypothetical protein